MNMNKIKLFSLVALTLIVNFVMAQSASVTPSRLYFKVAPGGYKSQTIRVTNNGTKPETFKVTFANFSSEGTKGKTTIDTTTEDVRGCSQWLSASPAFFEAAPGETKDVEILLQIPNTPEANTTRWAVASIKLARENTGNNEKGENVTGMQILQSFQFVVHIFQTPPSVTFKEAIIMSFYKDSTAKDTVVTLKMVVKNTGEAIIDCAPYLNIVNIKTGEELKVTNKAFTVLPGGMREVFFYLPKSIAKGEYNIAGLVDYGSLDIAGKELNLIIK
jgi:P pilus assembly chaperone PapD